MFFVFITYLLLALVLAIATYTDLKTRLIPNWLVACVLVLGLMHLGLDLENATGYLLSFLIGCVVWGSLFYAKAFGGGDAKLMMALSLFVLPAQLLLFYLCVAIAGGLQAGLWLLLKKGQDLPYGVAIFAGSVFYGISTLL